jgi:GntR family transcriptional regulator
MLHPMTMRASEPTAAAVTSDDAVLDENGIVAVLSAELAAVQRTPRYEQLIAAIEGLIRAGRLAPGAVLPRESDLAERLGLSRQTVGRALSELARRGLLRRRRGIGTFVAGPQVAQPLGRLSSFVRTLAVDGQPPDAHLLGVRLTVDPDASPRLTARPDGFVFEISRLFRAGGEPFAYEQIYLRPADAERLPGEQLAGGVIYDLLRDVCGIDVTHGHETMRLVRLDRTEAALLGAAPGDPAFLVQRITFAGDELVDVRRSLIRGDRAYFRLDVTAAFPKSEPTLALRPD